MHNTPDRTRDEAGSVAVAASRLVELERLAALGRASAGHAHELKNALMVLQGFAQLARKATQAPGAASPQVQGYVRELETQANRTIVDLRAFLTLARGGAAEEAEEETTLVDLATAVEDVARLTRPLARQQELTFELEVDRSARRPVRDPGLRSALLNLMLNALDFARTRVRVGLVRHRDRLEVRVEDDGPGVEERLRGRLFEPFQTGRPNGTGLGLAQVKAAVEAEGGEVGYEAAPDGGARFVVRLPFL